MSKNVKKSLFYDIFYNFNLFHINKYKEFVVENISKNVVAFSGGKIVGYVLDLAVDFESMKELGYYIVDNETEEEFLLKKEDIISYGQDFVLIDNVSNLEFVLEKKNNILGKIVVDECGTDLGTVRAVIFNKSKFHKIVTEKGEILAKYVKNVGQDCVLVSFKKKKNFVRPSVFDKAETENIVVKIQNQQRIVVPQKVNLSTNFYIGKVSSQDIFGYNNERIVSSGEKITKSIVEKARLHNKLNQLFFAIKR